MASPELSADFVWRDGPAGRVLVSKALAEYAPHLFSTRDLRYRGDTYASDRRRVAEAVSAPLQGLVTVTQVHGCRVVSVPPVVSPASQIEADGLVCVEAGRAVAVVVADCVPILLADRGRRLVAAVHAGWRGTAAGIAAAAVTRIRELGAHARDLVAAIGPSAGPCCYQVDAPVRDAFREVGSAADAWFEPEDHSHWRLNLWRANRDQLVAAGIPAESIAIAGLCSIHHEQDCWSYRREGATAGRMVAAIARPA